MHSKHIDKGLTVVKNWSRQFIDDSNVLYIVVESDKLSMFAVAKISSDYVGKLTSDGFYTASSYNIFLFASKKYLLTGGIVLGDYETCKIYDERK